MPSKYSPVQNSDYTTSVVPAPGSPESLTLMQFLCALVV